MTQTAELAGREDGVEGVAEEVVGEAQLHQAGPETLEDPLGQASEGVAREVNAAEGQPVGCEGLEGMRGR